MTGRHTAAPSSLRKWIGALFPALCVAARAADVDAPRMLGNQLAQDGDPLAAAVEYRRMTYIDNLPLNQSGYYWAAAYQYHRAGDFGRVATMLDHAEALSDGNALPCVLLRADNADSPATALECFQAAAAHPGASPDIRQYAARRMAGIEVSRDHLPEARAALSLSTNVPPDVRVAIDRYEQAPRKKPWLAGALGVVPGLGYMYSGEYANGLRALLLNGIFIYGMAETAADDQWAGFSALAFFELTWYGGSIYGGIDAAERYNQDVLNRCREDIDGRLGYEPDAVRIPIIQLHFTF